MREKEYKTGIPDFGGPALFRDDPSEGPMGPTHHVHMEEWTPIHGAGGDKDFPREGRSLSAEVPDGLFEPEILSKKQATIVVVNPTLRDVVVHPEQKVAAVCEAEMVAITTKPNFPPIGPSRFFFGDSPALESWKVQLCQKLQGQTNIFSLHEWNIGEAKGMEHQIQLNNPCPFHERDGRDG